MKIEKMTLKQATHDIMAGSAYVFGKVLAVFSEGWSVLEALAGERGQSHLVQECALKGRDVTLLPILGRYSYGFDVEVPSVEGSRSIELTMLEEFMEIDGEATLEAISTVKAFAVIDLQSLIAPTMALPDNGMPNTFDAGEASTDELISFLTANDSMVEAVALELAIRLQGVRKHPKLLEQATLLCSE